MDGLKGLSWGVVRMLNSDLGLKQRIPIDTLGGYDMSFV